MTAVAPWNNAAAISAAAQEGQDMHGIIYLVGLVVVVLALLSLLGLS